ncbi:MAG: trypsin-like peptidase domain-containing protein [Saccharofermentans sp.]|nr:trypsin-like peptidase domain-containing protein [Saccharofermentans sp.]
MDNNNEGFIYEESNEPEETVAPVKESKSSRSGNTWLKVTLVLLALCVFYSAVQTVYIYKLNMGLEGVHSYVTDNTQTEDQEEGVIEEQSADLAEPWFSLEEAASVSSPDKERLTTPEIVDLVSPATLSIHIMAGSENGAKESSAGTGFIITEDGYIVTNQHVVEPAEEYPDSYYVTVSLPGRDEPVKAQIVGSDVQTDIAVLKVDVEETLPCVVLGNSSDLRPGELVIAIGNALGTLDDTVTVGVVSALDRDINKDGFKINVIQTDAAINSGNSGGPLINSFGEVVGITNAKMVTSTSEGLGFAISIDNVKSIIESIINYGKVINRPYLGVSVGVVTDNAYYGAQGGVYAAGIVEGGPADQAGIMLGDRILTMDGVEITKTDDIIDIRDSHAVGDSVEVTVVRDGKKVELTMVIGDSADYEDSEYVTATTSEDK